MRRARIRTIHQRVLGDFAKPRLGLRILSDGDRFEFPDGQVAHGEEELEEILEEYDRRYELGLFFVPRAPSEEEWFARARKRAEGLGKAPATAEELETMWEFAREGVPHPNMTPEQHAYAEKRREELEVERANRERELAADRITPGSKNKPKDDGEAIRRGLNVFYGGLG